MITKLREPLRGRRGSASGPLFPQLLAEPRAHEAV